MIDRERIARLLFDYNVKYELDSVDPDPSDTTTMFVELYDELQKISDNSWDLISKRDLLATTPEHIEKTIESMVESVWRWGQSCGVDDVGFKEEGDSHNSWMRDKAMEKKDEVYMLFINREQS